jgi:mono/diheme cytochrome c family protein
MKSIRIAIAATLLFPPIALAIAAGDGEPQVEAGRRLYEIYCRNCHGDAGRDEGEAADGLRTRPPDLTRISGRNGGEFPEERVARAIDGRDKLRAHGSREMPVWGLGLQERDRDAGQEAEVRTKIRQLTEYLASIQRTD